jgi:WD40 repeat protein/mono/diheme cytochrome c family protein
MRITFCVLAALALAGFARADDKPVSYHKDIKPLFTANCNGCHRPEKSKGELDMTSYKSLTKGGKKGTPLVAGDPDGSLLVKMISGPMPEMPDEGDPLKPEQVKLVERWIREGAKDDTPDPSLAKLEPPVYTAAPVITSLAFSPDGKLLAVNGYHEIVLHKADGSAVEGRLVGDAPRVEAIVFSRDGKYLAACGGAPAEYGSVQVWDPATKRLVKNYRLSSDSLYGISFAPDSQSVAFGAADKTVRRMSVADGSLLLEFKAHADWVLGTFFTLDGKQLVSAGRDKAMKLIDVEHSRFVDDINNPLEACISLARHPKEEKVLYGGDLGTARIYRISDNQNRTAGRNDTNRLKEFERQPGPVTAVAFSPDGKAVALGSVGEVRVYDAEESAKRLATLSGHVGPVYSVAYSPDGAVVATGGFDGTVRLFDAKSGNLTRQFPSVPLKTTSNPDAGPGPDQRRAPTPAPKPAAPARQAAAK